MKRIDRRGSKIGACDQGELNKVETKMMDIPRKIDEEIMNASTVLKKVTMPGIVDERRD